MFEQLTQLVQQFGNESVVKNTAIPNEQNEAVLGEASNSILTSLQNIFAQSGGTEKIASLLQGNTSDNPVVATLTENLKESLSQKFGLNSNDSEGVAGNLVPKVLESLIENAKDPNHKGFEMSNLVEAISGNSQGSGLMDAISKYGTQFGLDQNNDGKLDLNDAMAAIEKKGGLGNLLGKLFGK